MIYYRPLQGNALRRRAENEFRKKAAGWRKIRTTMMRIIMPDHRIFNILHVDDNETTLYTIGRILKQAGYEVTGAASGADAMQKAQEQPDLIVLDVNLPDFSGFEVCKRLKADPATAHIPVLHLSATYLDEQSKVEGLEGGADGYLTHPVEPLVLIATIKSLLRIREAEKELRVHQIELGMQNEELRQAHAELVAAHARYFDLYDLAPVGYVTLSEKGLILEANLTAARLLGVAQRALINKPISRLILKDDQNIYYLHLTQLIETGVPQSCELRMVKKDNTAFWAQLNATATQDAKGETVCRIAISDINTLKQMSDALRESETLQRNLLANIPAGVIIIDPVTRMIESVNNTAAAMFGVQAEHIVGHRCHAFLCPASEGACPVCDLGNEVDNAEREMVCADGSRRPVLKSVKRIQIRGQEKLLESFVDISAQKRAEETLRESEKNLKYLSNQLEAILDHIPGLVFYKDNKNNFIRVNKYLAQVHMKNKQELEGKNLFELYPKEDAEKYYQDDLDVINSGVARLNIEEPWKTADGVRWVSTSKIPFLDDDGEIIGVIGMSMDITERKQAEVSLRNSEKRYRELSIIDGLTQLYNSRYFYQQLKLEIERVNRYEEQPLTLLLLDLDDFKQFNDTYGHVEGDQVLSRLGQVVKRCLRQTDSAYRYGGEEFTIILPMTTSKDAVITAERIRAEFKKETFTPAPGQENVHVTVSIGLGQYKPQEDTKAFVNRVDQLMYQAKRNGKNRVCSDSL